VACGSGASQKASPNAFEVSCRVRVGEEAPGRCLGHVRGSCPVQRLHPKERSTRWPFPKWVPRLCLRVSGRLAAVAELGARRETPLLGWGAPPKLPEHPHGCHDQRALKEHQSPAKGRSGRRRSKIRRVPRHLIRPLTLAEISRLNHACLHSGGLTEEQAAGSGPSGSASADPSGVRAGLTAPHVAARHAASRQLLLFILKLLIPIVGERH
jgi:hypothetical protein